MWGFSTESYKVAEICLLGPDIAVLLVSLTYIHEDILAAHLDRIRIDAE